MPKRGHCIFKSIRRRNARCSKSHVKRALKVSQNSVWDVPKPFKIEAWDGPGNPNAAMKLHRAAKRQPRVPPYIGRAQEQLSVVGVPSLLFQHFFFHLIFIPSKPSQTLPKTIPKLIFLLKFSYHFFALILHRFLVDFLLISNASKP